MPCCLCSVNGKLKLFTVGKQPISEEGKFTYAPEESDGTVWEHHRGVPPPDGSPLSTINPPLLSIAVLVYIYATAGIVFAVVCLVFNIVFRKKKLVQGSVWSQCPLFHLVVF